MMAVDKNPPVRKRRRADELRDAFRRHAIVADGQMDVAQAVLSRRRHVRLRAVHADDDFHPQPRQLRESRIARRLRAGEKAVGHAKRIVQTGRGERRGGLLFRPARDGDDEECQRKKMTQAVHEQLIPRQDRRQGKRRLFGQDAPPAVSREILTAAWAVCRWPQAGAARIRVSCRRRSRGLFPRDPRARSCRCA